VKGDGQTDDTAAFQKALDAAAQAGGGTVQAGRGNFFFAGHLNVPAAVTLAGLWQSVPAHNGLRDRGLPKPTDDGTTFLVTESAGKEDGPAFITLNHNSTLKGVVIYYPNQKADDVPEPYPWAVAMRGKNPAVLQVELLNAYNGIDATRNERHLIRDVQGQDEFWLIDLGSSNGTYLNGRRITQPCRLAEGDRVELANHTFSFRHPSSQRPALPTRTGTEKTIQEIKAVNCWLLVADMESSTQFIKATAPEESLRVTGRWLSACKQIIEDCGGTINKFLGDGFLAFWRDQENTPASVGKALEALRRLPDQAQPRFRIVLHVGKVYMGGTASLGEESLLGNDVNFVFRMEKTAGSLGAPRVMSERPSSNCTGCCPRAGKAATRWPASMGNSMSSRFEGIRSAVWMRCATATVRSRADIS
jgi:hypothetical protein